METSTKLLVVTLYINSRGINILINNVKKSKEFFFNAVKLLDRHGLHPKNKGWIYTVIMLL